MVVSYTEDPHSSKINLKIDLKINMNSHKNNLKGEVNKANAVYNENSLSHARDELSPMISSLATDYSLYLPRTSIPSSVLTPNWDTDTSKNDDFYLNSSKLNSIDDTTGTSTVKRNAKSKKSNKQTSDKISASQFVNISPKRLKSEEGINYTGMNFMRRETNEKVGSVDQLLQLPADESYVGIAFPTESIFNSKYYEIIPTTLGVGIISENNKNFLCEDFDTLSENNNSIISGLVSPLSSFPSSQCIGGNSEAPFLSTSLFPGTKESPIPTYPPLYMEYTTNTMTMNSRPTDIVRGLNGRLYHTTKKYVFKEDIPRVKAKSVYLTEDAYDIQEEKRIIENDENSRGQPALKNKKIEEFSSNIDILATPFASRQDNSYRFSENETSAITKLKKLSEHFFQSKSGRKENRIDESSESNMDAEIKDSFPFRRKPKTNKKIGRIDGLSISEIFKDEFREERKEFFSILKENNLEEKESRLIAVKNFISSSRSSRKVNRRSNNSNTPLKMENNKENLDIGNKLKDIKQLSSSVTKEASKTQISTALTYMKRKFFGENCSSNNQLPFQNQVHCNTAEDVEIIHKGKATIRSGINGGETNGSRCCSTSSESSLINGTKNDGKAPSSLFVRNNIGEGESQSEFASHHPGEKVNKSKELRKSKSTISLLTTGTNITEQITEVDLISKSENDEREFVSSSYVAPRKYNGNKENLKRDNLMDKLEHLRIEDENKRKIKRSIFQKIVSLFRNKDANEVTVQKLSILGKFFMRFRPGKRMRLPSSQNIIKHNNSVAIYREKRKKFFNEQNEFFQDSIQAYSNNRTPYRIGDDEVESQITTPKITFDCTVSEGVFPVRIRKRKLGQSTLGVMEDVSKTNTNGVDSTSVHSPTTNTDEFRNRGILKKMK